MGVPTRAGFTCGSSSPPLADRRLRLAIGLGLAGLALALVAGFAFVRSDRAWGVGVATPQPIPFSHAIHAGSPGLGALLTFAPRPLFLPHALTTLPWDLTPLEDQQLGGLLMWMPGGLAFVLVALPALARALRGDVATTAP